MKKSKRERDVNIPDTNFIGRDIIIKILFAFGYWRELYDNGYNKWKLNPKWHV